MHMHIINRLMYHSEKINIYIKQPTWRYISKDVWLSIHIYIDENIQAFSTFIADVYIDVYSQALFKVLEDNIQIIQACKLQSQSV